MSRWKESLSVNAAQQSNPNEGLGLAAETHALLAGLGLGEESYARGTLPALSPITGETLAKVQESSAADAAATIEKVHSAFLEWRMAPAPKHGELLLFGEELRASKQALGRLVSIETCKILSEGWGEVQEMIDICDFAVGLSRQLYGLTIATERRQHRMMETWHPVGVTGSFPSGLGLRNRHVNIGPSGAEIGGEKETGGGRESRSNAWKAYMRRATNTINYGLTLPLAQGVKFEVV